MDQAGGPEAFAHDVMRNHSKLPGTTRLRTSGIHDALTRLAALTIAVTTAAQLRNAANDAAAQNAWRSVAGLGPLSWSYLLMNAGVNTETKADVMVQRYLTRAVGADRPLTTIHARQLLLAAATELNVHPRSLDRAIWVHESRRADESTLPSS